MGWAFKVAATIDTRSDRSSCFTSSGTEANLIGPKIGKLPYFLLSFLCMIMFVKYVFDHNNDVCMDRCCNMQKESVDYGFCRFYQY